MSTTPTDAERALFEATDKRLFGAPTIFGYSRDGDAYIHPALTYRWKLWQAARALPVDGLDAKRYRWLREHSDSMSLNPPLTVAKVAGWGLEGWSGDDLNSAIDAAIAKQQEPS